MPDSLPTLHKFKIKNAPTFNVELINRTWVGRLTQSNLFKECVICGSSSNIQIHHLRSVKDVRAKINIKKGLSFAQ